MLLVPVENVRIREENKVLRWAVNITKYIHNLHNKIIINNKTIQ